MYLVWIVVLHEKAVSTPAPFVAILRKSLFSFDNKLMFDPLIRPAGDSDLSALAELYYEFHEFHVRGVPDRLRSLGPRESWTPTTLYNSLHDIIVSPESTILVADLSGTLIGLAEVYLRHDGDNPVTVSYPYAHLQSLMIREDSRYHRVGSRLLDAAEAWARDHGAAELRLDVWEFPEGPLAFYDRAGYRTLRRILTKSL